MTPESARSEITRLKADGAFVARYLAGGEAERAVMFDLHRVAFAQEDGEGEPVTDPGAVAAQPYQALTQDTGRGGVSPEDVSHLPDFLRPPENSLAYQLPPGMLDQIGFEGMREVQGWAHAAGLPKELATAVVSRANDLPADGPLSGDRLRLAEAECDAALGRVFGDQLDVAFAAGEKLEAAMEARYPGLMDRLEQAGVLTDPMTMGYLLQHAMRVYGPR